LRFKDQFLCQKLFLLVARDKLQIIRVLATILSVYLFTSPSLITISGYFCKTVNNGNGDHRPEKITVKNQQVVSTSPITAIATGIFH